MTAKEQIPAPLFVALVLVALVPAVGVLWFMSVAMRNERLAVQARLTEVYSNHLALLQRQVTTWVTERQAALAVAEGKSPAETFAALVRAGLADSVVVGDAAGKPRYPTPVGAEVAASADHRSGLRARELQAEVARLLNAGEKEPALARLAELVGDPSLRGAVGAQGSLIVPNARLLILKTLMPVAEAVGLSPESRNAHAFRYEQTLADLITRLNDYSDAALSSGQRRFLMTEVQAFAPTPNLFPTFAAEVLAADYLEREPAPLVEAKPAETGKLQRTALVGVWRLPGADRAVVALFREERLRAELEKHLAPFVLPDARVTVLTPGTTPEAQLPLPALDAGEWLPGWRLALGFRGADPLAEASAQQTRFYLWMGVGVVAIIAVVSLLVARYVAAQMRLARMKNELVSTVSHELRTPLASMRALVETLSTRRYRDDAQLHDYLQLIGRENLRLSQLIENFLAFSRLERGQLHFAELPPQEVVRAALDALGDRLAKPQCQLTTELAGGLPPIRGDANALTSVLVNLLDNACKYTSEEKRITVRMRADGGHVVFEVADNGIGIAREEQRRIFGRFYQVDQSLTRQRGGCGLGLSIVNQVVRAHGGSVEVESTPGQGSVFRVRIPAVQTSKPATTNLH